MSLTLTVFLTCIHSCLFYLITIRVETSWRGKPVTLIHHLVDTLVAHSYATLCNPMDCNPPGSSVHRILQARILEWVAFPSPGDILKPGTELSHITDRFFTVWANREVVEYRTTLLVSWETCMQVKKQQLQPDMEQWTGSRLGREYIKAVYSPSAYLIYTQSTPW